MKRIAMASLVVAACSGANALTLVGEHFSVAVSDWATPSLIGGALSASPWTYAVTNHFQGYMDWHDAVFFDWVADAGYALTGFSVEYNVAFKAGALGDWRGSGSFSASTGAIIGYTAPDVGFAAGFGEWASRQITDEVIGDLPLIRYTLIAEGLTEGECAPPTDSGKCGSPMNWIGEIPTTVRIDSIKITPHVAAIPEPSAYVLMVLGLAGLATRRAGSATGPSRP